MALNRRDVLKAFAYGGTAAWYGGLSALGWLRAPAAAAREIPQFSGAVPAGLRVAVIGSGIAGLTAAYELLHAGFEVSIFEADNRYGGRSLTVRPTDPAYREAYLKKQVVPSSFVTEASYVSEFAEVDGIPQYGNFAVTNPEAPSAPYMDLYLNAGPGRIPLHHTGVLEYCNKFGVKLEPYIFRSEANLLRSTKLNGGKPVQVRQYGNNLRGYLAELLSQSASAGKRLKPKELKVFQQMLEAYGDLTKTAGGKYVYLNPNKPGLYSRLGYVVEPYAGPYNGVTPKILSFEEIVNSELWSQLVDDTQLYWQSSLLQPVGGMDMVWQAFLAQPVGAGGKPLRDRVRLNAEVLGLNKSPDGLKVEVQLKGGAEQFDYVISTASPKVMCGAQFSKSTAIRGDVFKSLRQVRYEYGGKYGWQGRSRFWEQESQIFGGISWEDTLTEQVWYPSSGYNEWSGVLTGGYIHNSVEIDIDGKPVSPVDPTLQHATLWGEMSQQQRREAALHGGELLHPGFRDKIYSDNGISIAWQKMPYQNGISAIFDFTEQLPIYNELLKPVDSSGRVLLAGDWLSFWSGWQEGAVRSAWYAVKQLVGHATAVHTKAATG